MTREETIKILNDIKYQIQSSLDEVDVDKDCKEAEQESKTIPIPKNATNGDMIKAMFPRTKIRWITQNRIGITVENNQDYITEFELDWWNAPYKESEV